MISCIVNKLNKDSGTYDITINGDGEVLLNELVIILDNVGNINPEIVLKALVHHCKHMEEL